MQPNFLSAVLQMHRLRGVYYLTKLSCSSEASNIIPLIYKPFSNTVSPCKDIFKQIWTFENRLKLFDKESERIIWNKNYSLWLFLYLWQKIIAVAIKCKRHNFYNFFLIIPMAHIFFAICLVDARWIKQSVHLHFIFQKDELRKWRQIS